MTGGGAGAASWLAPLQHTVPALTELDVRTLGRFEETLDALLASHPVGPAVEPSLRSCRLARIRRELAGRGHLATAVPARHGGAGRPAAMQILMQFICGYADADLRDSTGLGHGRLIARHAAPAVRGRWLPRLLAGDLPGIAITEAHGGSQVHATATSATAHRDGLWRLNGTKTWISRLEEAAVFCVWFTDPAGRLTAGVVDAASPGLHRCAIQPAGLAGWAWGELHLHDVPLDPQEVLGQPGHGMEVLREHFAHYRPLVAATALGAAAGVFDQVRDHLCRRRAAGTITDLRDNALITLGQSWAQVNAAVLTAIAAQHLSELGDHQAGMWGCAAKAHGVDTACAAAANLAPLAGAGSVRVSSPLAKALGDLGALRYADGIHDSLYRAAGRALTAYVPAAVLLHDPSRKEDNEQHA